MLTKVKIVKEFNKKKYKFSFKKTKKPNLRNNNSENNIAITVNKKKIKESIPKSNLHFVSFVIGFYQELDIDDLNLIYLVNTCLLIKNENNIPMVKTFKSLGYQLEGRLRKADFIDNKFSDHFCFGIFKEEFFKHNKC